MTKKTIIKIIAYCTFFLVPFLISPVEIISQVQMISIIFVLVFIMSLASITKFVRQSNVKLTRIDILVVLFMLYQGYAIVRIPVATRDTINIYMYLATFIFYIHSRNVLTVKSPIILFHTVIFAALGQVIYSLFYQTNNFISIANIHGTFFNSGLLAGFISLATVSLVILIVINFRNSHHLWGKRVPQILLIIITILLIYIIFKLTSRAALIASSCGIIIVLFPRMLTTIKTLLSTTEKKVIISLFTILLLASVGYYLYQMKPRSAEGRILVWLSTVEMIKEKPVFGFGVGGFRQNYMNYQAEYLSTPKGKIFSDVASDTSLAFNEPLKIFAEQGVIGMLLILVLLLNIFKTKNEIFRRDLISLKALLCTIIVFGLFSYPSESVTFQVTFYAIIAQISRLSGQQRILHVNKYTIVILSSFIIVIYSCIGFFYLAI